MAMKQQPPNRDPSPDSPPLSARLLSRAMRTRPLFQTVMWTQMPLLALAGPRLTELNADRSIVELPYGWRTRNIFGTTYFAALLMAAEATTGGLVFFHDACHPGDFSYIVRGVSADFVDKARSTVSFACRQGDRIAEAFDRAADTGERIDAPIEVVGHREDGTEVLRAEVEWTWRTKRDDDR